MFPNKLLIRMIPALCLVLTQVAVAQDKLVTGKVTDSSDGSALANVSVIVKGGQIGTQTDSKGEFRLTLPFSTQILTISSAEYMSKDVDLSKTNFIEVALTSTSRVLNNVIFIGYGSARRKDLTGSVSSLSSEYFNRGIYTSPDQLIQGKVSGVQITSNTGQPGGAATIKIRGNSSLSGTGQPLFVIDGVPLDGRSLQAGSDPLNFINPDDVSSIDVLKDASATAIYGSRAAYGVIIINTKKEQAGPPVLTLDAAIGVCSILRKIDVLNASQFRDAIKYYNVNSDFDRGGNTNAFGAILQKGLQYKYSIGISGGNDRVKYRIAGNYLDQEGIIRKTEFKKYGVDFAVNFTLLENRRLTIDAHVNSSQFIQNYPQPEIGMAPIIFSALRWNPTDSLNNADGTFKQIPGTINPVAAIDLIKGNSKVTTVIATVSPSYKITSWLEYKLLANVNYSTGTSRSSENQDIVQPGSPPGSARIKSSELTTSQFTQTLTINKEIFDHLKLTAVAGYEYTQFNNKGYSLAGNGLPGTGFGNFGLDYTNYIQYSDLQGRSISSFADPDFQLRSYFGRTIFNYSDKYFLTATLRADGSSKFGENNKYGYFPSFAGAWNISKEKFFAVSFVNTLKIRAGWGKTGNQEFPAGSAQARYSFFDGGFIRQVNNPNPNLKWQSERQYNIGIDFSVFNNRISGTFDYFDKTTTNLLFPSPPIQPAPPDAVLRWINLPGKIHNKGFEVLINSAIISDKHWGIDLGVNATFLKNEVSGIPASIYTGFVVGPVQIIENGYPMNTFFTRKFLGIDKSGFSSYLDSGATFYHVGNPNPKFLLGITPSIHYKRLSLIVNLYGVFGQDIYYIPLMAALNVGGINLGNNIGLSVYQSPVKESLANPSQSPSSRFIFKGNYLKMANLTLNYALGTLGKVFKEINISVTGQNLFILTKYPGFSPETNYDASINGIPSLGMDAPHYPSSRTILFGLKCSL